MLSGCGRFLVILLAFSLALPAFSRASQDAEIPLDEALFVQKRPHKESGRELVVSITGETMRFYAAVAIVNYWDCVSHGDPVKCQGFLDSLEDPHTYIGFLAFVAGARATGTIAAKLPAGHIWGKHLGMAAGMFVSELYGEFGPVLWDEFRNLGTVISNPALREERRKALLKKLWTESLAHGEWWENKVPSLIGLFGGAFASGAVVPATLRGIKGIEFLFEIRKAKSAAYKVRLARQGMEYFIAGLRGAIKLHPAARTAGMIGETVIFLKATEYIEPPVRKWWTEKRSSLALQAKLKRLEQGLDPDGELLTTAGSTEFKKRQQEMQSFTKDGLEKVVLDVEAAWDKFRSSQMLHAVELQAMYLKEAGEFENQILDLFHYYGWIAAGMPKDLSYLKSKGVDWKPGPALEQWARLRSFFCGVEPKEAVVRAQNWRGFAVPGRSHDKVVPFRVLRYPDHCEAFPPLDSDEMARARIDRMGTRWKFLVQERDYTDDINRVFSEIMPAASKARTDLVGLYEGKIAPVLEGNLLNGGDSRSDNEDEFDNTLGKFRRGVIPSYLQELQYWKQMHRKYGGWGTDVFEQAISRVNIKRRTAQELLTYLGSKGAARAKSTEALTEQEFDLALGEESANWEKMVSQWKSFVLKPLPTLSIVPEGVAPADGPDGASGGTKGGAGCTELLFY